MTILPSSIESTIRTYLISQSGLAGNFVRNAASLYGTSLDKSTSTDIFESISTNDTVIFFNLETRPSGVNISLPDRNDDVIQVASYVVHIMCYGDSSTLMANTILARFRSSPIRLALANSGIYLESLSEIQTIKEFKNEVCWIRSDFDINITCEHLITPITVDDELRVLNILETNKELNIE